MTKYIFDCNQSSQRLIKQSFTKSALPTLFAHCTICLTFLECLNPTTIPQIAGLFNVMLICGQSGGGNSQTNSTNQACLRMMAPSNQQMVHHITFYSCCQRGKRFISTTECSKMPNHTLQSIETTD